VEEMFFGVYRDPKTNMEWVLPGPHDIFIQKKDYDAWSERARSNSFPSTPEALKINNPKKDPFVLAGVDLECLIGMLWPDQSFTSLRLYRGPKVNYWKAPFHSCRLDVAHGT
jgi:hypothetical protein